MGTPVSNSPSREDLLKARTITFGCRVGYYHGDEATEQMDGSLKYTMCAMIPKDSKELANIEKAIDAAMQQGASLWGGKVPANLWNPLRDGEEKEDENFHDYYFINLKSKSQPQAFDRQVKPLLDPSAIYSGCYANVNVTFYPFNNKSKGVGCGWNAIQFVADGEPFAGRIDATGAFAALAGEDDILA